MGISVPTKVGTDFDASVTRMANELQEALPERGSITGCTWILDPTCPIDALRIANKAGWEKRIAEATAMRDSLEQTDPEYDTWAKAVYSEQQNLSLCMRKAFGLEKAKGREYYATGSFLDQLAKACKKVNANAEFIGEDVIGFVRANDESFTYTLKRTKSKEGTERYEAENSQANMEREKNLLANAPALGSVQR